MDKIVAFPEAEAALIASMPRHLVHRMVVNLVKESKRVKAKNWESRATIETLESLLNGARCEMTQLESARDWAATSRARMAEQQQVSDRLQRELDATKTALSSAEVENHQLRAQAETAEKKRLRLEAKINALTAEKAVLKKTWAEAQRREMEATSQLALAKKKSAPISTTKSGRKISRPRSSPKYTQCSGRERLSESSHHRFPEGGSGTKSFRNQTSSFVYRKRPRAEGTRIPYPAAICYAEPNSNARRALEPPYQCELG